MAKENKDRFDIQRNDRRRITTSAAVRFPNRWSDSEKGRKQQFYEWKYIAMQVMRANGGICSIIAVIQDVFDFDRRACYATNDELADEAGRCSPKTISRDVSAMKEMGLIICDTEWIEKSGKKTKARRIRLSTPEDMTGIHIR